MNLTASSTTAPPVPESNIAKAIREAEERVVRGGAEVTTHDVLVASQAHTAVLIREALLQEGNRRGEASRQNAAEMQGLMREMTDAIKDLGKDIRTGQRPSTSGNGRKERWTKVKEHAPTAAGSAGLAMIVVEILRMLKG